MAREKKYHNIELEIDMGCIYLVRNKTNGKGYVGMTSGTLEQRKSVHVGHAKSLDKTVHTAFIRALRKYGVDSFSWRVLIHEDDLTKLGDLERKYIKKHRTRSPLGYNLTDGGEGNFGWIPSKETREKLSKAFKGKKHTSERIEKMRKALKGRPIPERRGVPLSPEHREKIRVALKGRKLPEEVKAKIKGWYERNPHPSKGKPLTEEQKKAISKKNKGRKQSPEEKAKRGASLKGKNTWMKGRRLSEETKKKLSETMKGKNTWMWGRKKSKETIDKLKASLKKHFAAKKLKKESKEPIKV